MFQGHQFIRICNDSWVFDLTEYVGYKVKLDSDGNVINYKEAYEVIVINDEIIFNKIIRTPLKVLKETLNVIEKYAEETCNER